MWGELDLGFYVNQRVGEEVKRSSILFHLNSNFVEINFGKRIMVS